jgi:hypothetical protein
MYSEEMSVCSTQTQNLQCLGLRLHSLQKCEHPDNGILLQ